MRTDLSIVVGAFPIALNGIHQFAKFDGLVGTGRIDVEGCFAIQPVVRTTQPQTFRRHHTDVVWREGLAQRAGVELVYFVIGQIGQTLVAEIVGFACFFQPFCVQLRFGINRDLHLIHDCAKIFVEASVQDLTEMLDAKALISCVIRNADPGDITLTDMLDTRSAVDKIVYLTFEHGFEIFLHLAASNLDHDAHVHMTLRFDFGEVRADHIDLSIRNIVQFGHMQVFEAATVFATEFHAQVSLADYFTFESRAIGNRYVYL